MCSHRVYTNLYPHTAGPNIQPWQGHQQGTHIGNSSRHTEALLHSSPIADMPFSLLRQVASVTALVLTLLQAFVEAQTNDSETYSKITVTYDVIFAQEYTSPDVRLWTSSSTSKNTPEITYGRISTIRLLTTTNEQGQPQTLAEVTTDFKPNLVTGAVATGSRCAEAICTQTTMSTVRTIGTPWSTSVYAEPAPSTDHASHTLSGTSVMRIFFGAISAFLALLVGVFLVSSWRRRRNIPIPTKPITTHGSVAKTSAASEVAAAYAKPELHATERALYEMDSRHALPEADGVGRLADGELEDKQAAGVAREREGRGELPEGKSNAEPT